jgi:1,4-dihydroxy-2-naphthoate octaprenyltransferase
MTIYRSTIQLLRFHFSFFLLPVYLFALSQVVVVNWGKATLVFIILHLLVYPASNGYNSYMDRDSTSVGGIKNPLQPTRQLFYVTIAFDTVALLLSWLIAPLFALACFLYIAASRAYSYRGIRLKKYPIVGYLTVILFQGGVAFWMVYYGSNQQINVQPPISGMIASTLLIGGFYPLTQIYQHEPDKKDGVITISALLGYRGTFVFTAVAYVLAMLTLSWHFMAQLEEKKLLVIVACLSPVLIYFFVWASKVWKSSMAANFSNTMRMNLLASVCTNLAFLIVLIWKQFE